MYKGKRKDLLLASRYYLLMCVALNDPEGLARLVAPGGALHVPASL